MKPVIAITPEAITLESRWDGRGAFCGVSYSRAIELAGGLPLVLPLTTDRKILDHFLSTCDGLMLTGGGDVNPRRYGARVGAGVRKTLFGVDDVRDAMEISLLRAAARDDRPVLAICRGIQVMNVAFGGTLLPDIPGHRHPKPDLLVHRIDWAKGGKLKKAMNGFDRVNTSHHQAIDRVADGFVVTAVAPDGIVEAMEKPGLRFFCGVQFHPERLVRVAPAFRRLFEAFTRASGAR